MHRHLTNTRLFGFVTLRVTKPFLFLPYATVRQEFNYLCSCVAASSSSGMSLAVCVSGKEDRLRLRHKEEAP